MRYCKFPGCGHKSWGYLCKMHRFPTDREVCQEWINVCGIEKTPTKIPGEIFVCSCHFVGGLGPTDENPCPIAPLNMEDCDEPSSSSDTHWHTAPEVDVSDVSFIRTLFISFFTERLVLIICDSFNFNRSHHQHPITNKGRLLPKPMKQNGILL